MPVLLELGRRHAGQGVGAAHHETILAALLRALHQALGVDYNAEVEEAWVDVYGALSSKLKQLAATPV